MLDAETGRVDQHVPRGEHPWQADQQHDQRDREQRGEEPDQDRGLGVLGVERAADADDHRDRQERQHADGEDHVGPTEADLRRCGSLPSLGRRLPSLRRRLPLGQGTRLRTVGGLHDGRC
jgi:hypothetical protein